MGRSGVSEVRDGKEGESQGGPAFESETGGRTLMKMDCL